MKAGNEEASLEAADVEPCRYCQARTIGISTLGAGEGGLGARDPLAAAGRLVSSHHFRETNRIQNLKLLALRLSLESSLP
jgi:hypothetical protein